jgi:hypothetical protein
MSNVKRFKSPYRQNISDKYILAKYAINEQNKRASFHIRVAGNKCRLTVWTNIINDVNSGKIEAVIEFSTMYDILAAFEKMTEKDNDSSNTIKLKGLGKDGYKGGKITTAIFYIGKDKDGILWLALHKKDRPKIKFTFEEDEWAEYCHKTGETLSKSELSVLRAKSYINLAREVIANLAVQEFVEINKDDKSTSYSSPEKKQSNYESSNDWSSDGFSDDIDDDIDM